MVLFCLYYYPPSHSTLTLTYIYIYIIRTRRTPPLLVSSCLMDTMLLLPNSEIPWRFHTSKFRTFPVLATVCDLSLLLLLMMMLTVVTIIILLIIIVIIVIIITIIIITLIIMMTIHNN